MHLPLQAMAVAGAVALAGPHGGRYSRPSSSLRRARPRRSLPCASRSSKTRSATSTGQLEALQFHHARCRRSCSRWPDDNEFRFQQLEGGGAGKTEAAPQSGGATPAAEAPQPDTGTQQLLPIECRPGIRWHRTGDEAGGAPVDRSDRRPAHGDDLGDSADPLLGQGQSGTPVCRHAPNARAAFHSNLSLDGGTALEDGDARAQYTGRLRCDRAGDYAFAEEQFRQFIALYPHDPQAPDATNWLGEALLQRRAYDEAADVLFTGFQTYRAVGARAGHPAEARHRAGGAGETDTACRTLCRGRQALHRSARAVRPEAARTRQARPIARPDAGGHRRAFRPRRGVPTNSGSPSAAGPIHWR